MITLPSSITMYLGIHILLTAPGLHLALPTDSEDWSPVCKVDGKGIGFVRGNIIDRLGFTDNQGVVNVVVENQEHPVEVRCELTTGDPRIHVDGVDETPNWPETDSNKKPSNTARGSVSKTLWLENVKMFWKVEKLVECNPNTRKACSMKVIEIKDGSWVKSNCSLARTTSKQDPGRHLLPVRQEVINCNVADWVQVAGQTRGLSACGSAGQQGSHLESYIEKPNIVYSYRNRKTGNWTRCKEFTEQGVPDPSNEELVTHLKCDVSGQVAGGAGAEFLVKMEKTHSTAASIGLSSLGGRPCQEATYFLVQAQLPDTSGQISLPSHHVYGTAIGGLVGVVLLIGLVLFVCWRKQMYKKKYINQKSLTEDPTDSEHRALSEFERGNPGFDRAQGYREQELEEASEPTKVTSFTYSEDQINPSLPITDMTHLLPDLDPRMELPRDQLKLGFYLGQGQFGTVYQADASGLLGEHEDTVVKVAVKEIKDTQAEGWADELRILSSLEMHLNLVNLLGACTQPTDLPTYILLEYCTFGDLKKFLCKHKDEFESRLKSVPGNYESPYTATLLLRFSYDIAQGMEYLAGRKVMHGDLAARNVMVGENYTAKISDFGLSKVIPYYNQDYKKTQRKLIPWAWMATEYLKTGDFNIKSDVWSFGVVLWEIFTVGNRPYGINADYEAEKMKILSGERLPLPELADMTVVNDKAVGREVYHEVMQPCWQEEARLRPAFSSVVARLADLLGPREVARYTAQAEGYSRRREERARAPRPPTRMDSLPSGSGYIAMEELGPAAPRPTSGYSVAALASSGGYIGLQEVGNT